MSLSVDADIPAGTDLLGKLVTDLQSDIVLGDGEITGALKYVTDYADFSGDASEQSGNYLVLHSEATDGATVTVELDGGAQKPIALDADGICILRISDTVQSVRVTASKPGHDSVVKTYALAGLTLEEVG